MFYVPFIHHLVYCVQYGPFTVAPFRGDQKTSGSVAGEPVDGDVRRYDFQDPDHQVTVFFDRREGSVVRHGGSQSRALYNIEKVELQTENVTVFT